MCIRDSSVPGLPEKAAAQGLTPLEFMRKYGAVEVERDVYEVHERPVEADEVGPDGLARRGGKTVGVEVEGVARTGFGSPTRRLEWLSTAVREWGGGGEAIPNDPKTLCL